MRSISFRLTKVLSLFLPPLLHIALILLALFGFILVVYTVFSPKLYSIKSLLLSGSLFLMSTYVIIYALIHWYRERNAFLDSEHYLILVVLAVYSATAFSALNYLIYRYDNSAFFVDETFRGIEQSQQVAAIEKDLNKYRHEAELSDKIASSVLALGPSTFSRTKISGWWKPDEEFKIDLNLKGIDIYLRHVHRVGRNGYIDYWTVNTDADGEELFTSDTTHFGLKELGPVLKETIAKEDLVNFFMARAEWDRVNWVLQLEGRLKDAKERGKEAVSMPLSLFMYQGAMNALSSDPSYFKPANAITRLIALIYSFLKFVYFGAFVSLIVTKRWSYVPEKER